MHFPFCIHLCNYCDFYKHKLTNTDQITKFEDLLEKSWVVHQKILSEQNAHLDLLETLYLGGGTPSLWGKEGANYFEKNFLNSKILIDDNCEFTMEVDPNTYTDESISAWRKLGVNRFSLGVQAFRDEQLKLLDRKHSQKDVENTLNYFKKLKTNFSIDILIGAPSNNNRNIKDEIHRFIEFEPSHFSVYILQTRKNYPHNDKLPLDEKIRDEYLEVVEILEKNGFDQYEVSNFAKSGKESKHNLNYWKYNSVSGLGPNATGLIVKNENEALRYQWKSLSAGYQLEELKNDSLRIEKAYLGLRNSLGLSHSFFTQTELKTIQPILKKWSESGYLKTSKSNIRLSPLGYLMLDSLIDDLFKIDLL